MNLTSLLPRLLLVEDSDEDAATMVEALALSGVHANLVRVVSGDKCMELLRLTGMPPALVVMDLNLPGMDGREALAMIKNDHLLKSLPVVVVSTSANPRDVDFCYAAGANAYHVKPIHYADHLKNMTDLINYWLGKTMLPCHILEQP